MKERIEGARPMMDLMAKKIFSNTAITAQFIRDIFDLPVESVKILESTQIHEFYLDEFPYSTHIYKRQSKNVQKWEFKNVQFYSLNISFKR